MVKPLHVCNCKYYVYTVQCTGYLGGICCFLPPLSAAGFLGLAPPAAPSSLLEKAMPSSDPDASLPDPDSEPEPDPSSESSSLLSESISPRCFRHSRSFSTLTLCRSKASGLVKDFPRPLWLLLPPALDKYSIYCEMSFLSSSLYFSKISKYAQK